ncbi:ThiF family adenylyltransferase [Anoxynatronum buryatiense]|uniref:Molybdopterin or thiamine biosynthesis adenylyltransferase n=1 Tax=Anoxynatronum buryatiense TaxID=489973 RepID=A0AA45WZC1_9CLOT|nr:ThiF family adenylyltransferase [Anoxynatronum buryatiense]SMP72643.1 Molybdopterin or thiamine biosynthesis adenylyltransferase [Anoxynatronum buryatiense]
MLKIIENIFSELDEINCVDGIHEKCDYAKKSYLYLAEFSMNINGNSVDLVLGVPKNWTVHLFDVYIKLYKNIKLIPHMSEHGKLCLYETEGILIDSNFTELLKDTIHRTNQLLIAGLESANTNDFVEEFENYWLLLPDSVYIRSLVLLGQDVKKIKCINRENSSRNNTNKIRDIICADSELEIKLYSTNDSIYNGLYIPVTTKDFVYPPDWRLNLNIEFINGLLNLANVDYQRVAKVLKKNRILLIFNVFQPSMDNSIFGVFIWGHEFDDKLKQISFLSNSNHGINPGSISRCDKAYLVNRGGGAFSGIVYEKVLIIGCGSIGGYFISELIKAGFNNITIVDDDKLEEANIFRHILGMEHVDMYKVVALHNYLTKNYPYLKIFPYPNKIEELIEDGSLDLKDYDLIISAVGNHNVNRMLNRYVFRHSIKSPTLYLWNEVLGIGSHAALIQHGFDGCYDCFFEYDESGIYDRTTFAEKGQHYTRRLTGCGSTFMPFSSLDSIRTTILGMDAIKTLNNEGFAESILISKKGDASYFETCGYRTSSRYENSKTLEIVVPASEFKKDKCIVCGSGII